MTPQQRRHLTDLIHAAFERAQQQGTTPPIDLAPFGLLLRQLEPGFSHQSYGHEKLLYLLRNEFDELLHIRKDAQSVPPRYAVSLRQGLQAGRRTTAPPQPRVAVTPPVIDMALVDNSLLEQFLQRLAATSATTDQRLNDMERQLRHMANELEQSRANEVNLNQKIKSQEDSSHKNSINIKKIKDNDLLLSKELINIRQQIRQMVSGFEKIRFNEIDFDEEIKARKVNSEKVLENHKMKKSTNSSLEVNSKQSFFGLLARMP
ncbi:MAG: hypothetical protein ACMV0H_00060 [Aquaspirillum sp.]